MALTFAPDGRIAYTRVQPGSVTLVVDGKDVVAGEDLYPFRPAFTADGAILYGSGGKLRRWQGGKAAVVPFTAQIPVTTPDYNKKARDFTSTTAKPVVGIAAPMLSPDGKQIVFAALNDLYLMPVGGTPASSLATPSTNAIRPGRQTAGRSPIVATGAARWTCGCMTSAPARIGN